MNVRATFNLPSALLALALALCLSAGTAAQAQVTNQSSVSLQEWQMPPAHHGGSPPVHPVPVNQENINVATQEADVVGCAQVIDQVIFQTSLNFNLFLQGFPATPFDPSQILQGLDFSKITPLDKIPFTIPVAPAGVQTIDQTAVQTSININEPGATPPAQSPNGISLTVTDINGDNVSEVNQANLNVAAQLVTGSDGFGTLDQAILQSTVDFSLTVPFVSGQPFDLSALLSGLDFVTPLQVTSLHTDGPGCPTGPGAPPIVYVDQTIIQRSLNFNILRLSSDAALLTLHQSTDDTAVQQVNIVPEPASLALLGVGIPGLIRIRRAKKRREKANEERHFEAGPERG